jgi:outer membrane immunogenic protein
MGFFTMRIVQRVGWFACLLALIAGSAHAGDHKAPTNWTDFYAGVNAGYGWSDNSGRYDGEPADGAANILLNAAIIDLDSFATSSYSQDLSSSGFVGGGQLGYNWQFASWVAGIEADLQSGVQGDASVTGTSGALIDYRLTSDQDVKWFGTARARLGYLATPDLLLFGTGGFAYGRTEVSANISNTSIFTNPIDSGPSLLTCPGNQVCIAGANSRTSTGWTAGGGFEWALWSNVTFKGEYLQVDLGDQTIKLVAQSPATGNGFVTAKFDNSFDVVRGGLNYGF